MVIIDHRTGKLRYIKGFKNGLRKAYYTNGKLAYDGEWKDGIPHGKGKSYHLNGQLQYNGEWRNEQTNGKGKSYFKNGKLLYDGEWKDNKIIKGILYNYNFNYK